MAVDTRNKRASVLGLGLAFRLVLPNPDASVDTADRPHLAYCYAGIAVESPVPFTPDVDRTFVVHAEARRFAVADEPRIFVVPGS